MDLSVDQICAYSRFIIEAPYIFLFCHTYTSDGSIAIANNKGESEQP